MSMPIPEDDDAIAAGDMPLERVGRGANARMRPPQRAQVREPGEARESDTRLVRTRKRTDDRFHLDPRVIPAGMSYEWKAESVYGQKNLDHIASLQDNHWKPVPQERHPGLVVRKDGMILMERPAYLTDEARREDLEIARDNVDKVRNNIGDTPQGQFSRDHPSARRVTGVHSSFESVPIPEE